MEIENKRKKFCSESCKYWFNSIKKDNEKGLPPVKKRNENYFYMIVGSERAKSNSRQGKRSGSMVTGSMSAMVYVTVEEIVELNRQCDSVTNADVERIAKSNSPTDKPLLREGSRISSFHEGVTDFKIKEIKTINEKTEVTVTLSNKHYPTQKQWDEKIIFIEQNRNTSSLGCTYIGCFWVYL
jgi:signal recognition particle subunit SEC65